MEEFIFLIIGAAVIFAVIIFAAIRQAKKKMDEQKQTQEQYHSEAARRTTSAYKKAVNSKANSSKAYDNNRINAGSRVEMHSSIDTHVHLSSNIENYGTMSGSLGEVNDEGCPELNGLRLIVHDEAYETDDGSVNYDIDNVGLTMILGQVLENPKYKKR